jgi:AcrR family transcriptional regulator
MAPVVTEAHLDARHQQILDAAWACFSRDGFHRSTMQSICTEAHLSPGAIYRYFKSKEDIIFAMCEGELKRNLAIIEEQAARGDTETVLSGLADHFFERLGEDVPHSCRVNVEIWAEALRNPRVRDALQERIDLHLGQFAALIRHGQERGHVNPDLSPAAVARHMLSAFHGLVLQKALDPDVDVDEYVDSLKKLYFEGFLTAMRGPEQGADAAGSAARNGRRDTKRNGKRVQ